MNGSVSFPALSRARLVILLLTLTVFPFAPQFQSTCITISIKFPGGQCQTHHLLYCLKVEPPELVAEQGSPLSMSWIISGCQDPCRLVLLDLTDWSLSTTFLDEDEPPHQVQDREAEASHQSEIHPSPLLLLVMVAELS